MRKGIYKEYQCFNYHDSHVKGSIDVARPIKLSTPFLGKIAYTTREFSFDNALMQLIRHTIEYIKSSQKNAQQILFADFDRRQCVTAVMEATPSYRQSDRQRVLLRNQEKVVRHAYYHEYAILQRLCLMILGRNKQKVGGQQDKVHGILFDVAWLWEEYLASLLGKEFIHPRNKGKQGGISIFSDRKRTVYPDFYDKEKHIVLDAKYKKLDENGIRREDMYQIISYSYILEATTAGFIFPRTKMDGNIENHIGKLAGYGCELKKWGLLIPQACQSFEEFCLGMKKEEEELQRIVRSLPSESSHVS